MNVQVCVGLSIVCLGCGGESDILCLCVSVPCKAKMRGRGDACFPFG